MKPGTLDSRKIVKPASTPASLSKISGHDTHGSFSFNDSRMRLGHSLTWGVGLRNRGAPLFPDLLNSRQTRTKTKSTIVRLPEIVHL